MFSFATDSYPNGAPAFIIHPVGCNIPGSCLVENAAIEEKCPVPLTIGGFCQQLLELTTAVDDNDSSDSSDSDEGKRNFAKGKGKKLGHQKEHCRETKQLIDYIETTCGQLKSEFGANKPQP